MYLSSVLFVQVRQSLWNEKEASAVAGLNTNIHNLLLLQLLLPSTSFSFLLVYKRAFKASTHLVSGCATEPPEEQKIRMCLLPTSCILLLSPSSSSQQHHSLSVHLECKRRKGEEDGDVAYYTLLLYEINNFGNLQREHDSVLTHNRRKCTRWIQPTGTEEQKQN